MKRVIKLTESDLTNLIRRIIKENEKEWVDNSMEIEDEADLDKLEKEDIRKIFRTLRKDEIALLVHAYEMYGDRLARVVNNMEQSNVMFENHNRSFMAKLRKLVKKIKDNAIDIGMVVGPTTSLVGIASALGLGSDSNIPGLMGVGGMILMLATLGYADYKDYKDFTNKNDDLTTRGLEKMKDMRPMDRKTIVDPVTGEIQPLTRNLRRNRDLNNM
jgi:hypothetical protein